MARVDIRSVHRLRGVSTGTAVITVDKGENTIVLSAGANGELMPPMLERMIGTLLDGVRILCLCFEVPMQTVVRAATEAHQRGVRVLLNPSPSAPVPLELLQMTDLLILNGTADSRLPLPDAISPFRIRLGQYRC